MTIGFSLSLRYFVFLTKFKIVNKRIPDIAILNADIDNGEIPNNNVRYSIRID